MWEFYRKSLCIYLHMYVSKPLRIDDEIDNRDWFVQFFDQYYIPKGCFLNLVATFSFQMLNPECLD
eukprot:UN21630